MNEEEAVGIGKELKNLEERIRFYEELREFLTTDIAKSLAQEFTSMKNAIWEARDTYFSPEKDWLTQEDTAKLMKIKYQAEQMDYILNYFDADFLKGHISHLRQIHSEITTELGNLENNSIV